MSDIHHVGFLYDDSGDPIVGATVQAYEKNSTTTAGSSTTTNSDGKWSITTTSDNQLDILITSGSSKRRRKFDDAIQVSEIEVSTFNIREGATAQVYTIAPGSISADRTLTLPAATGNDTLASLGLAQTFSAAQTFTGAVTVGSDGSGTDVIFYSGTAGDNLTWDASEEVLNITGTNGATALDVLDGDVRIVDKLYFYDRGGEYLSSDGSTLTITGATTVSGGITSTAASNTLGATSFNDAAITNVGDIALDSISADGTDINIAVSDDSATAFTIKQGSDAYLIIDTANSSESVSIGTGISGTAITIGNSTSETTVADNLTVTGNMTVNGTTTTVNSTTTTVDDPIFTLGGDTAPGSDDNKDRGIEFRYHDGSCARIGFFGYDDSASVFTGFTAASNSSEVFSGTVINAKFGSMNLGTVAAAGSDTDKFLVLDSCGNVDYRTGTQVLSDIGGSGGSTVTVTDNESTNENNLVTFVADAGTSTGSHGLEMDGNFHYNPSTGLVTATGFSGNLTGTLQTAAQGNVTSLGTLTALTVDCVAVNGKVVTMTGSACDTIVMTAATNGAFSLVTTDTAAAAANIQITADGTVDIDSAGVLTLDSGAAINLEPASGSAVLIDGTVSIDGAAITGATSILATDIKIGEDDQTKIAFACANIINLHANNIKALSVHNTSSKGELRFYEGCNYVGFAAPALSANQVWALPTADGSCGQFLKTDGSGALAWACASGGSFDGTLDADLSFTGTQKIVSTSNGNISIIPHGTGAIGIGSCAGANAAIRINPAAFTATACAVAYRVNFDGANAMTVPSGTSAMAAGINIGEPNITATGTVTTATTVRISGAPTEGSSNYALLVDDGTVRFDGVLEILHTGGGELIKIRDTNSSGTAANGFISIEACDGANTGYMGKGSSNGTMQIQNESAATLTFGTSGYTRLTIAADGTFSGSASADISDSRIKENVENTTVGLAEILQLRPVKYNFISGKGWGQPGQKYFGFLAQEVEAVIPEAVETADIDVDEEQAGKKRDPNGIRDLKSVTMTQITTAVVKAIQELNARVTALE